VETNFLSQRISRLTESETLQMAKLSRELRSKGADVIDLSLGEPDFNTPAHICEAADRAMKEGFTKYPPVAGFIELRQAIAEKFQRENQLHYTPDQILVSTGAKQCIANIMMVLVNPGDEVIIPAPYWVSYREIIKMAEGNMVTIPSTVENDFKITAEQLENAITPKTKVLCFSSPCNPSGSVYTRAELKSFAEVLKKYPRIFVISDEIYEHINFTGHHESIAQFDFIKDRVIIVNGVSKAFAMTGWRIGYLAAPAAITRACDKMQGQITSGANSIAQRAALAALSGSQQPTRQMCAAFQNRKDLVVKLLNMIPGLKANNPKGAFYVFPEVKSFYGKSSSDTMIQNADDLCMYLLHQAHVTVVTGRAFGNDDCIRISYAASEERITEGLQRMKKALANLS
jgi:aspartate aminotransferase